MARDTKGAFDGADSHPHQIDWRRAAEVRAAFLAEEKRKHDESIARRKEARKAAAAKKRGELPPV